MKNTYKTIERTMMKKALYGKDTVKNAVDELKKLADMPDEKIDYSDIPEITDFTNWQPNPFFKPIKSPISAKLDKDIIMWLKMHGSVSKFLNQICREKMMEEVNSAMQSQS